MKHLQRLIVTTFRLLLVFLVLGTIFVCYGFFYVKYRLPNVEVLKDIQLQVPMKVYTSDNKLIGEFGEKRRIPITLDQVPTLLQKAVIATEDQRFYEHSGVDFIGLVRAVKQLALTGRKEQGASTITMQVARNFFLSRKKTYSRKINEILLALMIDHEFSKQKILELYLNKIFLGYRSYGVAAAARVYYGKNLDELTLAQMAMIAGLAQAPSYNNPILSPKTAKVRRNHVLTKMLQQKYITRAQYEEAVKEPITATYHGPVIEARAPYLAEMVRQAMYDKFGEDAYTGGFKVYTTVDSKNQDLARESLQDGLLAFQRRHPIRYRLPKTNLGTPTAENRKQWIRKLDAIPEFGVLKPAAVLSRGGRSAQALMSDGKVVDVSYSGARGSISQIFKEGNVIRIRYEEKPNRWVVDQAPAVEGALVSLNPHDGALIAIVGGFDFNHSKFNRATQGELQPGSNFKPFIYSAALAQGFTLASIVNDAPIVVTIAGQRPWRPQNASRSFRGPTRLRVGLIHSVNLMSVRLLEAIGIPNAIDYVTRFGFDARRLPKNLTMALGTAQVTPLEMANAFSVFANGGYKVSPYFIQKIVDANDEVVYAARPKIACTSCNDIDALSPILPPSDQIAPQIITPQNAFLITSVLQDVIRRGTGRRALVMKREDIAGKTGTTNDKYDAWFSGFNGDAVTTVWVGYDRPRSLHEYGGQAALPIWISFMSKYLEGKPENTLPEPPGLIYVRIDPRTGLRTPPGSKYGEFEVFRSQFQPEYEPYYNGYNYNDSDYNNDGGAYSGHQIF